MSKTQADSKAAFFFFKMKFINHQWAIQPVSCISFMLSNPQCVLTIVASVTSSVIKDRVNCFVQFIKKGIRVCILF